MEFIRSVGKDVQGRLVLGESEELQRQAGLRCAVDTVELR